MKFLHVFDTAGVAAILSNELRQMGHQSDVLQLNQLDPFGFGEYYGNTSFCGTESELINRATSIGSKYDHVIVHDYAQHLSRFRNPIIWYHGSMLKHIFANTDIDRNVEKIFVTMPHLTKFRPNAVPMHIPVDTQLFSPRPLGVGKLCITSKRFYDMMKKELPKDVDIRSRDDKIVPYKDMPNYLSMWAEYVERRYDYAHPPQPIDDLSSTALQCLALGMKVTMWDKTYSVLPYQSDSKYFAERFIKEIG